ncbi:hypothetical protein IE3_05417 [Bacillus cereus BAG3X2-1]|uniref:zinc-ribbon domain-containing protein n=1 Tax=Bacillus nitratireducens TaxID=2026193 RepID=UPI0002791A83|nr:zinc-ribbon domain-containing protein [Bacillus nitratireducens]EJQ03382.1 hypothetical protein IE3_05417 [Bacillus cereus BAG3X2-1]PFI37124.1 hypothetical protein COI72_17425 [Bacillus cereus]PGO96646.1 hypothetical protein CN996_26880 [Bacillus cereus]PGU37891.1 hypothetical protein COD66_00050 [Bacillus cereus]
MSIANKVQRNSSPYYSNQKLSDDNRLYVRNPRAVKLWHPTKHGRLSPKDVSVHPRKKVWWQCEKGHEWETSVSHISREQGCPYCSNRRVTSENCLASRNPQLSLEWHPSENGKSTPKMIMPGSRKKVWWQCKKGHEWRASIDNTNRGRGCPYCSGKVN